MPDLSGVIFDGPDSIPPHPLIQSSVEAVIVNIILMLCILIIPSSVNDFSLMPRPVTALYLHLIISMIYYCEN